jgi:hypothetical protein
VEIERIKKEAEFKIKEYENNFTTKINELNKKISDVELKITKINDFMRH